MTSNPAPANSPPHRATLLGLPPELRLQIYDRVLLLDIDFCIERASPLATTHLSQSLSERWDGACDLPINILAQTCRLIANEIRSHAASLPPSKREACIELRPRALMLYSIHLHRLPCRIRQLQGLELETRIDMPAVLLSRNVKTWVRNKVNDLSATLVHLLEPEKGILKHASGIGKVTLWVLPPAVVHVVKKAPSQLWAASFEDVEYEFRKLLEQEVEGLVRPQLGERRLVVI